MPFLEQFVAHARLEVSAGELAQFFGKLLGDIDEPTTPFGLTEAHRLDALPRTMLGVALQLRVLFDTSTIARFAREIAGRAAALTSDDELDDLPTQIEALAPEKAQRLLDQAE